MSDKYLIAGGDLRFVALAESLSAGNDVYAAGFDRNISPAEKVRTLKNIISLEERVDYIILPLPVTNDGTTINMPYSAQTVPISAVVPLLKENGLVFGGRVSNDIRRFFSEKNIDIIDYSEREEFAVMNATATAEGAIQVAMEETASTIAGQKILIIGMGRISKALIHVLSGFNADITIAARKYSDLAWAEAYGCKNIHTSELSATLDKYSIIFNTVPAVILDAPKLKLLSNDCLVIDLASKPGGVDFDTAASIGIRAVWLLSLPGKVAPLTSGTVIGKTIANILAERGVCR